MVALYHHTAHTTTGGYPDIMALVFCDTADVVIAESLLLRQVLQIVSLHIQNVQTFTRSNPDQSTGVLKHLRDIIVGKRLHIVGVTCQYFLLRIREVHNYQTFGGTDKEVVGLTILIII